MSATAPSRHADEDPRVGVARRLASTPHRPQETASRPSGVGRRRTRRVVAGLALLALAMVVLAGCGGAAGALIKVDTDLRSAGFNSPNTTITAASLNTGSTNGIQVNASLGAPPTTGDFHQVASIIWPDVHYRFDYLEVSLRGGGQTSSANYTFGELTQTLGARPAAWNRTTLTHSLITLGAVVLGVGVLVVAGVVVLIVLLVRRKRRRQAAWLAGGGGEWSGSFGATYPPSPPPPGAPPVWYPPDVGWYRPDAAPPGPYASPNPYPAGSYPPPGAYPAGPYAPPNSYPPPGPFPWQGASPPPPQPAADPAAGGWPAPAGSPTSDEPAASPPSATRDDSGH